MKLSKNDKIELEITALTSEGSGVGKYDGMAVFVRGTVPQDKIIAHIIKVTKSYAIGIIDKLITPSPERIESDCPHSNKCGGCSFRHLTYDEELRYKRDRVQEAIRRIGHLDVAVTDIIGADELTAYRNKAQYPVDISDGELFAGFYAYKSHRIIPCADCRLQPVEFQKGLEAFSKWVEKTGVTSYDETTGKGFLRHIYFRKAFATNQIMACAVINGKDIPERELLIDLLREALPELTSVIININTEKTNVILGKKSICIWGSEYIEDELLGVKFRISPNSFYQVNHNQCERLYAKARELAKLSGDEVLVDLYCGVGTIGLTMAKSVRQLVGIEIVPQAVDNARGNAKINGIDNTEFICADAREGARQLERRGLKPDVVILDPPRKGCDKSLFETIEAMSPKKIVYISCDPATLARDMEILDSKGYHADGVTAVDMFPRTPHIESVVLLRRD